MRTMIFAAAALALPAMPAYAASFINGGFESGLDNVGQFTTLNSGDSTSITGWTVGGSGVDYIGTYWTPNEGARSIDLSALGAGSLAQTFDTVAGKSYRVSFYLAGNPAGAPLIKTARVSASGNAASDYSFDETGFSLSNMGWALKSYDFVAGAGTSTTLTFASLNDTPYGPALDNVSISAVPEPASWALMIAGFGFAGASLRRRTRASYVTA